MEKNEETKKKACLAVYCNGWGECEAGWCDAEQWCKWHPKYHGGIYHGESILAPIFRELFMMFNFIKTIKEAADKWG